MRQCIKCKLFTEIVYKDMCYVCFINGRNHKKII